MPELVVVFEHAAVAHERSAALHDRAAAFFEQRGDPEAVGREHYRAHNNRRGATKERERARRRRDLLRRLSAAEK